MVPWGSRRTMAQDQAPKARKLDTENARQAIVDGN